MSKKIGYMRVSKSDGSQTLDLQRQPLLDAGVRPDDLYEDYASGKFDDRPGLNTCLAALMEGDTLVIWKLDRLGRNLKHLIEIIEDLNKRKIGLKVITEQYDTTTAHGMLIFNIFANIAQYERALIIERTQAGLAAARARGRCGGRPRKIDVQKLRLIVTAMQDKTTNITHLAQNFNIKREVVYSYVRADGTLTERGKKLMQIESA